MPERLIKPISPISQVLRSIGLTRDDLVRHSDQMRQFLTQHDPGVARIFSADLPDQQAAAQGSSRTRSLSRSQAPACSQTPPPSTPVKSEPVESAIPLRQMDSMEMILERKSRRAKREKKAKAKDRPPPSPSPARASFSLDAFMQSRDSRRVPDSDQSDSSNIAAPQGAVQNSTVSVPPVTPQHRKYYRDYDAIEPPSRHKKTSFPQPNSPTPTRSRTGSMPVQAHSASQDADPFTPRRNNYYKSPLPSSSPPRSSPFATPSTKRIVNLVSSPGPMGPLPDEDEYDRLPYKLPPGPYSKKKPELSYAALIGQAVLSSPEHRLTLQEIYDWITIVYPYFQRNETTWMNSIRHVLSTTVCFRKMPRDRSLGRTQWAIWECDLECFANGNFRKEFCAEYKQAAAAKKAPPKKRPAEDAASGRKTKRQRKGPSSYVVTSSPAVPTVGPVSFAGSTLPSLIPVTHFLPMFPPCPSVQHQPYYEQCTQLPVEVIFPPLPPTSHYARVTSGAGASSLPPSSAVKSPNVPQTSPAPPSSSLPELIPNNGSSSSPQLISEDHPQTDAVEARIESTSPSEPGGLLEKVRVDKGKLKEEIVSHKTPPKKSRALPPMPVSPTLDRRTRSKKKSTVHHPPSPLPALVPDPESTLTTSHPRLSTPPPRPSTPPRNRGASNTVQLSPTRTPLSHKGLRMIPNASLAHFKTNLDPPPHTAFNPDDGINPAVFDTENVRTPSRKRHYHRDRDKDASQFPPVTPKKLVFPAAGESPSFRTPGARIFDPHDPGALLDEEFARLGARAAQESPAGLYDRRGLLYESPNMSSPGKLPRWY